ncbi:putative glutaredoxin, Thioredoxin-like superfamily [Helianthus annuus]|uniref:Glutaredoxin-like, plant II, Thioredoxin-like superfamily n=1 Tax=Helianthus annuus TaxID=4232 RepID=A0A9K3JXF3_HELAN|nr:glutaredoxin-C9-like [Helianthus annuus]KAF5822813.1 putative glutaredoxin-like, plant II, Thioredoxin-like superfamily [Helianthus annuus]KAJ0612259.1 putative glutaredoxin, Thioredoxin-like superfamily [Helianthus annuus]KAJ0627602.1 putative glutaredoxin, Thioredoxin-like superfamily [Helianthus annuus]KAJ0783902.1 putative glutaredoxin, Thioredoxin-like superfamily [Helianthus annuus]KAJ0948827.1 putative glutaredoxin, Thioredoxin-like superfamily [Helianthus annuus]
MQQAIPYKTYTLPSTHHNTTNPQPPTQLNRSSKNAVRDAVTENAVIVLARHGCCMSHVVKRLLNGHGVNPSVFEFEEDEENDVVKEIEMIGDENGRNMQFPAVFIGGRMFGGLDQVMTMHISGELIPVLKQAGALWL